MYSVTKRIESYAQPRGGLLPLKLFDVRVLESDVPLYEKEDISGATVGSVVDYMSRYIYLSNSGCDRNKAAHEAFEISLAGASMYGKKSLAETFVSNIISSDVYSDDVMIDACRLVQFDGVYRAGYINEDMLEVVPDEYTLFNIKELVKRSVNFLDLYGPVICSGFKFGPNGYSQVVSSGDGDFLANDTLWDFKCKKSRINKDDTLQVGMYYVMAKHSGNSIFDNISNVGFFNPRSNTVFTLDMKSIDDSIIKTIEDEVICYGKNLQEYLQSQSSGNISSSDKAEEKQLLSINDITELTGLSRRVIMRLYEDEGLPLKKIKNKYQISFDEFHSWMEWYLAKIKQEKRKNIIATIVRITVIILVFVILIYWRFWIAPFR